MMHDKDIKQINRKLHFENKCKITDKNAVINNKNLVKNYYEKT